MSKVTVQELGGGLFRLMDVGEPAMHNRNPIDGGVLRDRGAADKLAADVNARRDAAEKRTRATKEAAHEHHEGSGHAG
jgi:hypothetical protein